jgi:hypothetical protein
MLARQLALLALLALLAGTYAVDAGQCDDEACKSSIGNDCCSAKNFGDETMNSCFSSLTDNSQLSLALIRLQNLTRLDKANFSRG